MSANKQHIPRLLSLTFQNFKALRQAILPLEPLTILIGPNGSGKSTVLQALEACRDPGSYQHSQLLNVNTRSPASVVSVVAEWLGEAGRVQLNVVWRQDRIEPDRLSGDLKMAREQIRTFSFDPEALSKPVPLEPSIELARRGYQLAAVLDRLRDTSPEQFERLNSELNEWLPEFDRILFENPRGGMRAFLLRQRRSQKPIPAAALSDGTLLALALLTLANLPEPPSILGLEEPDHGLHPRLLQNIRDALVRLAYPENTGLKHPPVQVVATTHSPYLLDLFRDMPECIVIASKESDAVFFTRLIDIPNYEEIIADSALGEVWYSGILGGVPAER